jgi:hypothetical protein
MSAALVLAVEVEGVGIGDTLERLVNRLFTLTYEQVEVVSHEAVGVVGAALRDGSAVIVVDESHALQTIEEILVVLGILENHLVIDTTHHDVVDTGGCFISGLAGHGFVGITLITTEKELKYCTK